MPRKAPRLIGALIVLLGLTVMSGWIFEIRPFVQLVPGLIAMVFNTALCFVLAGCALATQNVTARRVFAALAGLLAAVVLAQDFFRLDLGVDQLLVPVFMPDPSPFPGRMAPQTCICFLLTAFTLVSLTFPHRARLAMLTQAVAIVIGVAGFVSLVGYSLQLELVYSWYRYTRMAAHTAGGFTLLALGLWLEWYRITIQAGAFDEHEDRRVTFVGGAIIVIVAVSAGVSGFALLAHRTQRIAMHALEVERDGQMRSVAKALGERASDSEGLARMPELHDGLRDASAASRARLQRWSEQVVVGDIAAVSVYSPQGSLLARAGSPLRHADIDMAISPHAQLLWRDGARVRTYKAVAAEGGVIGTLEVEARLPIIAELLASTANASATGDLRICGAVDDVTMQCLPTRLAPQAVAHGSRTLRGVELPASLALRGESSAKVFVNFRGMNSVGAYGKLPAADLAFVMQQEANETYGAIRKPLRSMMLWLAVLVIGAIVMLHWQVAPLVRKMMLAKAEAATNAARIASIMNSVPDGIVTIDRHGAIAEVNPAVSALFGYTKDELIGQNIKVLMPESMRDAHEAGFGRYTRTGERKLIGRGGVEVPGLRKDRTAFLMQLSLTEMVVDSQRFVVGVMRDVTERNAAERLKDEFISVVSHELRTPLTSISGSLGLIAAGAGGELPPKASRLVQIAN